MISQQKLKTQGISRNKFGELNHQKGRKKVPVKRFSKKALRKMVDDDFENKSSLLSDSTGPSQIEMTSLDQPLWIEQFRECQKQLKEVQFIQVQISKENSKKMSSFNREKHQKIIQQFIEQGTNKLGKCQKILKNMQKSSRIAEEQNMSNKTSFTHMLISLATKIRSQARKLRNQQQNALHRQKQLDSFTKNVFGDEQMFGETENWFSEQQFEDLQKNMVIQRNKEVNKIVQSIYSLNTLYKQLQNLVIEQGSLLDRIDQNIEQTQESTHKAVQHLQEANQKQESKCANKTKIILIVAIFVLFFILILKNT